MRILAGHPRIASLECPSVGDKHVSQLTLSLLGPPHIARDGMPLQVDTRKAIALLAYLAVVGAPQRRDTLATLLWPDSDQPGARAGTFATLIPGPQQ